jgi:hypothetical protein
MKLNKIILITLLAIILTMVLSKALPSSAFPSPLSTPTLGQIALPGILSPLSTPVVRSRYVGRELVLTQEAQYVIEVAATRSAVATRAAATITPTDVAHYSSTPVVPSLTLIPTAGLQ